MLPITKDQETLSNFAKELNEKYDFVERKDYKSEQVYHFGFLDYVTICFEFQKDQTLVTLSATCATGDRSQYDVVEMLYYGVAKEIKLPKDFVLGDLLKRQQNGSFAKVDIATLHTINSRQDDDYYREHHDDEDSWNGRIVFELIKN